MAGRRPPSFRPRPPPAKAKTDVCTYGGGVVAEGLIVVASHLPPPHTHGPSLQAKTGRDELKRVRKEYLRMRDDLEAEQAAHTKLQVGGCAHTHVSVCTHVEVDGGWGRAAG